MAQRERTSLRAITADIVQRDDARLCEHATPHSAAKRRRRERTVLRSEFARDRDRILYSDAYKRYAGKTQVVFLAARYDEHISTRLLHTTYVSQVSRSIVKALRLNFDLVEAIAVGHDLGHTPFGHDGEAVLDDLCREHGIGPFRHNVNSLWVVDQVASRSRGLNLTLQVRDGILCHDGESSRYRLRPSRRPRPPEEAYCSNGVFCRVNRAPATLEGCVVRLADSIAYLGQDLEDAIRLGVVRRNQLPRGVTRRLGTRGSAIINNLIIDLVKSSHGRPEVGFSGETTRALLDLKAFNYEYIYHNKDIKKGLGRIRHAMRIVFEDLLLAAGASDRKHLLYRHFLHNRSREYREGTPPAVWARDFIASMTDHYLVELFKRIALPEERPSPLRDA